MRIVTFADGFVSTTPPSIDGAEQETYTIANNASDVDLFSLDAEEFSSAFINFEISRSDAVNDYSQTGQMTLFYTEALGWQFSLGLVINDEIVSASIDNPYNVVFSFTNSGTVGTLGYSSGSMGSSYLGVFKIIISKVQVI